LYYRKGQASKPVITVSEPVDNLITDPEEANYESVIEPSPGSEGMTLIVPRMTTASIPKSPLKAPTPNIPLMSPVKQTVDKRARTFSTSEVCILITYV